ncbi:hypothetical protein R6Q59_025130 [Mikania micrantha]
MGNCQAIDNASLVIQHPTGKVERLYSAISAAEVMKLNPGHYVALLLTTTVYSSRQPSTGPPTKQNDSDAGQPLRITRIKLLRPTESLTVGHIYRLITSQEVMKGLMAKKNGKISSNTRKPISSDQPAAVRFNQPEKTRQKMKTSETDRRTVPAPVKSSAAATKPRGWHPSLNSISEASS